MLAKIGEIAPAALVVGVVGWGAINWAFLGPELGARTLRADGHLAVCESGYADALAQEARSEIAKIERPSFDARPEVGQQLLGTLFGGPLGELMDFSVPGSRQSLNNSFEVIRQQREAANREYQRAVDAVKARTTRKLDNADDFCRCVADQAVSKAQTEFAVYSGTLTLFRPAAIRDLNSLMRQAFVQNSCDLG